jgi:hypothetical protein
MIEYAHKLRAPARFMCGGVTLICVLCSVVAFADNKNKVISKDTARKAIMRVAGLELKKSAVQVRAVAGTSESPEVSATLQTIFRFKQPVAGGWQAVEVRVGDRQWEEIDLLARAWHVERATPFVTQLEALTAQLAERERAKAEAKKRHKEAEAQAGTQDQTAKKKKEKSAAAAAPSDEALKAGPLRVKNFSALLSSATVETEIDAAFRLSKDARGQWQVSEARIGDGQWQEIAALVNALNAEKITRARADLATLAAALEAFRRERGFYLVADTSAVLVDQLNPRYTAAIIRIDPWHRPYEYTGTSANFTLRSLGPDGKPNTADDVTDVSRAR